MSFCLTSAHPRARSTVVAALALLVAAAPHAAAQRTAQATRRALERSASVAWRNAPLGPAVRRLMAASDVPLWIDRRVDPDQRIVLAASQQPLGELLDGLAASRGLGTALIDGTVYFGPAESAAYLTALPTHVRRGTARGLRRRGDTSWQRLTTPRQLAEELVAEAGHSLDNPEAIPHDLWDAGAMTDLAVGDRLTLVLLGFDLRWKRPKHKPMEIRLSPIAYEAARPAARTNLARERGPAPKATEQRFTLRVRDQRAVSVLGQLTEQLGRELVLERQPEGFAGRRVSFAVSQASVEELFEAVAEAAGVAIRLDGRRVIVGEPTE